MDKAMKSNVQYMISKTFTEFATRRDKEDQKFSSMIEFLQEKVMKMENEIVTIKQKDNLSRANQNNLIKLEAKYEAKFKEFTQLDQFIKIKEEWSQADDFNKEEL